MSSLEILYHYYERDKGPFLNLSDLPLADAQRVLDVIKAESSVMAAQRYGGYLERRRALEQLARRLFVDKGGNPRRAVPHTMVVGLCAWLETWYQEPDSYAWLRPRLRPIPSRSPTAISSPPSARG